MKIINEENPISVLMAVHAGIRSEWFKLALDSIESQLIPGDELVLVVDGELGVDTECEIQQRILNPSIKCIRNSRNMGLAISLNRGLRQCSNDLVARADADDISSPRRLKLQREFMAMNPETVVSSGWVRVVNHNGDHQYIRRLPKSNEDIRKNMWRNVIAHSCTIYRKKQIVSLGGYREDLRRGQDYELWFRVAESGYKFANLQTVLVDFRASPDDFFKSSFEQKVAQARIGFNGCRLLGLGKVKQVLCFIPLIPYFLPDVIGRIYFHLKRWFK
jgi:glycosyltransferase involved in cell wall biosynthesis